VAAAVDSRTRSSLLLLLLLLLLGLAKWLLAETLVRCVVRREDLHEDHPRFPARARTQPHLVTTSGTTVTTVTTVTIVSTSTGTGISSDVGATKVPASGSNARGDVNEEGVRRGAAEHRVVHRGVQRLSGQLRGHAHATALVVAGVVLPKRRRRRRRRWRWRWRWQRR
jgi:hypothetical protein